MLCSGRVKEADLKAEQKWDFISLNDFKTTSCFAYLAYGYLWISLLISVAVYGVDTFTAVNLLAFNKWSGEIQPKVPFSISKWIFASCIIASWVNLAYEHLRAMRVMKRGAVAESYLDSLAVRIQSIRLGKGRGYRRFLVFAELTKSKKGAEYVALFTYFSFQAWIRIIFCQGPRQVMNALTLYSVYTAKLEANNAKDVGSFLTTFFKNIALLAKESNQQALVLSGMVFTMIIWIFGALSLILATIFYVFFLWHWIPNADGGLSGYCQRKVDKRLSRIVSVKVNKAIAKDEERRLKADAKSVKKGEKPTGGRQATLPVLYDQKSDDKLPQMPILSRNDTMTTLPMYTSRPGTPSDQPPMPAFELDELGQKRPFNGRSVTNSSTASNAPLMGNASDMGYGRSGSPAPSLRSIETSGFAPQRTMTGNTNNGQYRGPAPGPRMPSAMGDGGYTQSPVSYEDNNNGFPPPRMPTAMGDRAYTQSPMSYMDGRGTPQSQASNDTFGRPVPRAVGDLRSNTPAGPAPSMGRRTPFDPYSNSNDRSSPAPLSDFGRNSPAPGRNSPAPSTPTNGYQAYNPNMRPAPTSNQGQQPQQPQQPRQQYRNMTDPGLGAPQQGDYFNTPVPQRPGTSQGQGPARLASPAPYNQRGSPSPSGFGGVDSPGYRKS
ncbi:putative vacuolar membrane protein [Lachnellula subtilissima]|uniref:Putative vacuolar membrane protein n=1 Tax=Lachnellula subtilissima TaxID=602034 RepID=A0A8H8RCT5_9HELO|nr:putative vacuolar membrane protein [Lachnellula subtilissima]